uniref:Uncharacterized protein n=1 Tax=Moniliophthora roreri TaxID=221103 RepID=A0A0W0G998_MONRR
MDIDIDEGENDSEDEENEKRGDTVTWLNRNKVGGLALCDDTCIEHWKAAGPDSQKTFALFAISGIFVAVELMKYPLGIVNVLIDNYGDELSIGYDIIGVKFKDQV